MPRNKIRQLEEMKNENEIRLSWIKGEKFRHASQYLKEASTFQNLINDLKTSKDKKKEYTATAKSVVKKEEKGENDLKEDIYFKTIQRSHKRRLASQLPSEVQ